MQYLKFIDGLRAIAVTAVVAYHAGIPGVPGGFVGVDIFFVISGYLITGLLLADLREHNTIRFGVFFARRVRRLMPALMLVLLVTGVAGSFVLFPEELPRLRQSVTAVALVIANFHFLKQVGGYFAPATDTMPLLHTWSLAVEEQYYIVWPLILLGTWRVMGTCRTEVREKVLLSLFASVFALSLSASLWYSYHRTELAFYMMPTRAWELMAGGLLALTQDRIRLPTSIATGVSIGGLLLVIGSILFVDASIAFPGWVAILPAAGTTALILGLRNAPGDAVVSRLLAARPFIKVGLLSYSWYLWHWPALALTRAYYLSEKDILRDVMVAALSFVLAWLTYRYIENPIRFHRPWLFARPRGTFIAGLAMTLLALAIPTYAIQQSKHKTKAMVEAWEKAAGAEGQRKQCLTETVAQVEQNPEECIFGSGTENIRTVFWGDSHSGHFVSAAEQIAESTHQRILMRSSSGCPPLPDIALMDERGTWDYRCTEVNDLVIKELDSYIRHGLRNVILSARWTTYPASVPTDPGWARQTAALPRTAYQDVGTRTGTRFGTYPADHNGSLATMHASLDATLTRLLAAGINVVLVAPTPELPFNAWHCIMRRSPQDCVISRDRADLRRAEAMGLLQAAVAKHPEVKLYDPIETFCDASLCYASRSGTALFHDDDHISHAAARQLAPSLQALLR